MLVIESIYLLAGLVLLLLIAFKADAYFSSIHTKLRDDAGTLNLPLRQLIYSMNLAAVLLTWPFYLVYYFNLRK